MTPRPVRAAGTQWPQETHGTGHPIPALTPPQLPRDDQLPQLHTEPETILRTLWEAGGAGDRGEAGMGWCASQAGTGACPSALCATLRPWRR